MTPEEAKPHVFRYASTQGQPGDVQLEKETGERMPIGTPFFTAKETAEIAKAFAQAIEDNRDAPCLATERPCNKWRNRFKEWSK